MTTPKFKARHRQPIFSLVLLICLLLAFQVSLGMAPIDSSNAIRPASLSSPNLQAAVHDVNKVHLVVTNKGQLGWDGKIWDSVSAGGGSCLYPYPYKIENLYAGGFWVGAIVGDDTLVTTGYNDFPDISEFWPESSPDGAIISHSTRDSDPETKSDLDIIAVYTDTLTDTDIVKPDPYDNRPHKPLGIKITQSSYTWNNPIAEDIVIFYMKVSNIGPNILKKMYFGIYIDGDVFRYPNVTGYNDDLCGFRKTNESFQGCNFIDTLNLAWISDNNGFDAGDNCPYTDSSLTSVMGVHLIWAPSDSLKTSFNWWIMNSDPQYDFGPRQIGTAEDPFRDFGFGLGTPVGDANKYYMMSHPEIDYDQHEITSLHPGWLPAPENAMSIVRGADIRYLLSFGPFEMEPGQTLPIAFAYVGGAHFLDEYCNYHPAFGWGWYDLLGFDDIAKNAVMAGWIYDNPGVDTDGDGYYGKYRICGHDSILVVDSLSHPPYFESTYVYTSADTFYYTGDAYPDLKIPDNPTDIPDPGPVPSLPDGFSIGQNYPNPFNLSTVISYDLPRRAEVSLTIYNIMGQIVRKIEIGSKPAGKYSVVWDGNNDDGQAVASGIYLYKIDAGSCTATKKMILLK
ncbi:hypothetical protein TRIP_C10051 [Candidatus Zixiibacteriota bacterium]|nr:hypothetical protein TRIP_C10051 [candidate division Zixibacteria bacterium]